MPSPFPGMNPWLERASAWESFHPQFISAAMAHLARQVPKEYVVRIESRVYIHEPSAEDRFLGRTDVGVARTNRETMSTAAAVATPAPSYVTLLDAVDIERLGYITIRNHQRNDLVALIELLSPTNKYAGPDREQYLGKRREILRSHSHFVEIDLLRGGPRMPPDELPSCDYCAIVSRFEERPKAGVWSWRLQQPMPTLPIPLRAPDADVWLDLSAVVNQVYDEGLYSRDVYDGLPEPRLSPDDMAWAAQFLPTGASLS